MFGPEVFGQFTTAHTLATTFILFADFGFDLLLITEISKRNADLEFTARRMFFVKVSLSALATGAMCLFPLIHETSDSTRTLIFIFSLYLFLSALVNFFFALFKAHQELQHESSITVSLNAILLILLGLAWWLRANINAVAIAFVVSRLFALLLAWKRSRRFLSSLSPVWDRGWFSRVWKEASVFGAFFVFGTLFFTLDTMLLYLWKGEYFTGIYQSVFRIIAIALVVPEIVVSITLPGLVYLHLTDEARWRMFGQIASRTLFYLGLVIGLFLFEFADVVISVVYGSEKYASAIPVLRIFGAIIFVRYAGEIPALMLTTSQRQTWRMIFVVAATVLNFLMNAYAIPRFGVVGAAWVSLITNCGLLLAYNISMRDKFVETWLSPARLIPLSVAIIGGVVLEELSNWNKWGAMILLIFVIYVVVRRIGYSNEEQRQIGEFEFAVATNEP